MPDTIADMTAIRVLVGKPGLDGHDRGAKVIARALQDSGIDVFYTGLHQTATDIVDAAETQKVDAIGLSILSGAHLTLFPAVLELLKERGLEEIPVFGGGIIPSDDVPVLLDKGVAQIFLPGTPVSDVVDWVSDNVRPRSQSAN